MKGTFAEFDAGLNKLDLGEEGYVLETLSALFDDYAGDFVTEEQEAILKDYVGSFEVVESYGGEGQGDDWFQIVHLIDWGFYIKVDAYYQSFDGVQWDGAELLEVKPKTVTKTIYE